MAATLRTSGDSWIRISRLCCGRTSSRVRETTETRDDAIRGVRAESASPSVSPRRKSRGLEKQNSLRLSQVFSGGLLLLGKLLDGEVELVEEGAEWGAVIGSAWSEEREAWTKQSAPCSRQEHGGAESEWSDAIPVGVRDALDDPVKAKPTQVVGHPGLGHGGRVETQQLGQRPSELFAREPIGLEDEQQHGGEQSLSTRIIEAEGRGALLSDLGGTDHSIPRVFADGTVMADSLDVE